MEYQRHPIIGNQYFAQASSECQKVFLHGCYFACITLCQSLAEAYARFLYEMWTGKSARKNFESNIRKIKAEKVEPDVGDLLENIYGGQQRHDFHHLNKEVPQDYEQLRIIAREKISLLNNVEAHVFYYETNDGKINVKYPKYWKKKNGELEVFLRLDP